MSALAHKRICAAQTVMSALPLKADMCGAPADVRFVLPIADIGYRCGGAPAKSLTTAVRASGPTFTVPANG